MQYLNIRSRQLSSMKDITFTKIMKYFVLIFFMIIIFPFGIFMLGYYTRVYVEKRKSRFQLGVDSDLLQSDLTPIKEDSGTVEV